MTLTVIFLLFSVLGAMGTWVAAGFSAWWLLLLIPAYDVGISALYMIILWIVSLFLPKKDTEHPSIFCELLIRLTMEWVMILLRVRIRLIGADMIPEDVPCVIVSNHRSDFDPMTVLAVLHGRRLAYISKEGNFRIPIVGPFIRRAGFLAIDRENGMRALRTLKKAADLMTNARIDMGIYPEGTRSKTGELLEFKTGAFYLAKKADAPIVVMTTKGTEKVSANFPFRRTNVTLKFLQVIDRETVRSTSMEDLSTQIRALIEQDLAG